MARGLYCQYQQQGIRHTIAKRPLGFEEKLLYRFIPFLNLARFT
jgi:hypothetical protein